MPSFEIENGIPVPKIRRRSPHPLSVALANLKPGQSVFMPNASLTDFKNAQSSLTTFSVKNFGKGNYAIRKAEKNGVKGYRVWNTTAQPDAQKSTIELTEAA